MIAEYFGYYLFVLYGKSNCKQAERYICFMVKVKVNRLCVTVITRICRKSTTTRNYESYNTMEMYEITFIPIFISIPSQKDITEQCFKMLIHVAFMINFSLTNGMQYNFNKNTSFFGDFGDLL